MCSVSDGASSDDKFSAIDNLKAVFFNEKLTADVHKLAG